MRLLLATSQVLTKEINVIESSCHCGAVKLQVESEVPDALTDCNCSICRRYGSLLAYFNPAKVKILAAKEATDEYFYGNKGLAFVRCKTCGCLSHWRSLDPKAERMGVNARLFTNVEFAKIRIRHFDGADTWTYID